VLRFHPSLESRRRRPRADVPPVGWARLGRRVRAPAQSGGALPNRTTQYLYLGALPFCCLPSVPRAFVWSGGRFHDVTRDAIPELVGETLGESRATVRSLAASRSTDSMTLDAATIRLYAAAIILEPATEADRRFAWLAR
jgi:hypothetical protein